MAETVTNWQVLSPSEQFICSFILAASSWGVEWGCHLSWLYFQKKPEIWILIWTLGWRLYINERNMQTKGSSPVKHIQPMRHWSKLRTWCIDRETEAQRWEGSCLRSQRVHFRDLTIKPLGSSPGLAFDTFPALVSRSSVFLIFQVSLKLASPDGSICLECSSRHKSNVSPLLQTSSCPQTKFIALTHL